MIEVWHPKKPSFGLDLTDRGIPTPVWPDDYTKVAEVETDNLDEAYAMTQHREGDWVAEGINGSRVKPLVALARSTAVGDVLVRDGKAYAVLALAFKKLS